MIAVCIGFVVFGIKNGGTEGLLLGLSGMGGEDISLFSEKGIEIFLGFGLPTAIGLISGPFGDQSFWQRAFAVKEKVY